MADQGKWFKLWCTSLRDDDLENMSIHDWFGWARLGAHIKENGRDGKIRFTTPGRILLQVLRVDTFEAALDMIKRFPNVRVGEREVTVTPVTDATVTCEVEYLNWFKFQGDFSNDRVRKFRDKKRHAVTAQEEKRRRRDVEEKRREVNTLCEPPKTEVALVPPLASPYQIPDKIKDPSGNLVIAYKLFKKIPKDDRSWDKTHFARAKKTTKTLLEVCGAHSSAVDCIAEISAGFEKKGLDWTIETILKHAHDWKRKRGLRNAELENGKGISMVTKSIIGLTSENKRGGGLIAAGTSFAGVRNMPSVELGAKNANGKPDADDGQSL